VSTRETDSVFTTITQSVCKTLASLDEHAPYLPQCVRKITPDRALWVDAAGKRVVAGTACRDDDCRVWGRRRNNDCG
jgi:hypothetical protein